MAVSKNGYLTLRKIQKLKEAEIEVLARSLPEVNVQNAINSLKRSRLVETVKTVSRKITDSRSTRLVPKSVYAITVRGAAAIKEFEAAAARKAALINPPTFRKITPTQKEVKKQELHLMQNWIIPERDPNVSVVHTEINGHTVKVTYGNGYEYERYSSPADLTRYRPNPIKGIHSL